MLSKNQLNPANTLIAVGIVAFWFYFSSKIGIFSDDLFFKKQPLSFDWLSTRYHLWSSRLLIESVVVSLLKYEWILRAVTFLIIAITPIGFYLLLKENKIKTDIRQCAAIVFLLPLWIMNSAGWAATLINYWYPLTACVFALYFVSKEKLKIWEWALLIPLTLFGVNLELNCIGVLGLLCLMLWKGHRSPQVYVAFLLTAASLAFILTAPGNHARTIAEIKTWLPAFAEYTPLYKAYIGTMRVIQFHFFHVNICFAFVASAIAYLRFKKIRAAVLSLIAVTILQYLSYTKLKGMVPFAPFEGAWHTKQYLAIALTLLWGGVLLWGVLTAEISAKMKVCVLTLLAIAFAIPSAMGFSPTVWASNLRTMMPCEFLLVGLGMGIFGLSCCSRDDLWKVLYCCLIIQVVPIAKLILGINPV